MRNKLFASAKGVMNLSWCTAVLFLFVAVAANGTSLASSTTQISAGLQTSPFVKGDAGGCPEQFESISGIEPANPVKIQVQENYGKLPLYFIQNDGQMDKKVKYYEKGNGHAIFFTEEGIYISLTGRNRKQEVGSQKTETRSKIQNEKYKIRSSHSETPNSKLSTSVVSRK